MWSLHIKIYEQPPYPVVEHIFRGRTKREAMGYYESHLKTDSFLRDCVRHERFQGISCHAVASWRRS